MEITAHFGQEFCCLLNLPSVIQEQYLIQHMKHVPQVFLKGIKLHLTLLLKKRITRAIKEDESLQKLSL